MRNKTKDAINNIPIFSNVGGQWYPVLYDISDVCRLFGMTPNGVRFYEEKGFVQPDRTSGGRRKYTVEDLEKLMNAKAIRALEVELQSVRDDFIGVEEADWRRALRAAEAKIQEIRRQMAELQASQALLYEFCDRVRLMSEDALRMETFSLPALHFLPMEPLFGRGREEQEAIAVWLRLMPETRQMNLYLVEGGNMVSVRTGFGIWQRAAERQELPLLERAELIDKQDVLRVCCPADEKAWDCLGKGTLEALAAQAEEQRHWRNVWVIDTFLYAQTEGERRSYFREVWVGEWKTE